MGQQDGLPAQHSRRSATATPAGRHAALREYGLSHGNETGLGQDPKEGQRRLKVMLVFPNGVADAAALSVNGARGRLLVRRRPGGLAV